MKVQFKLWKLYSGGIRELVNCYESWKDALHFIKTNFGWCDLEETPLSTIFFTPLVGVDTKPIVLELEHHYIPFLDMGEVIVTAETSEGVEEIGYFKNRLQALDYIKQYYGEPEAIQVDELTWYGRAGDKVFCVAADIF